MTLESEIEIIQSLMLKALSRKSFHEGREPFYVPTELPITKIELKIVDSTPFRGMDANPKMISAESYFLGMILENLQAEQTTAQGSAMELALLKNTRPRFPTAAPTYLLDHLTSAFPDYSLLRGLLIKPETVIASFKGYFDADRIEQTLQLGSSHQTTYQKKEEGRGWDIFLNGTQIASINKECCVLPYRQLMSVSPELLELGIQHFTELITHLHHSPPQTEKISKIDLANYLPMLRLLSPESYLDSGTLQNILVEILTNKTEIPDSPDFQKTRSGNYRLAVDLPHVAYVVYEPKREQLIVRSSCDLDLGLITSAASDRGLAISQPYVEKEEVWKTYKKGSATASKRYFLRNKIYPITLDGQIISLIQSPSIFTILSQGKSTEQISAAAQLIETIYSRGLMSTYSASFVERQTGGREIKPGLMPGELDLIQHITIFEQFYHKLIHITLEKHQVSLLSTTTGPLTNQPSSYDWVYQQMQPNNPHLNPFQRFNLVLTAMDNILQYPEARECIMYSPKAYGEFCRVHGAFKAKLAI